MSIIDLTSALSCDLPCFDAEQSPVEKQKAGDTP